MRSVWEWLIKADVPGGVPHILWLLTYGIAAAAVLRIILK